MHPRRLAPSSAAPAYLLLLAGGVARAAAPSTPDSLDQLVARALDRQPELAALELDSQAAAALVAGSGRLMDPQWMVGVQALGAMPDSADPTMFMVGVEQMLSLPPVYRAARDRAEVSARWTAAERARAEADLRERLWAAAAQLRAETQQADALAEQIAAAEAALAFGLARYGAGGGGATTPRASTASGEPTSPPPALPAVERRTGPGTAMPGMGAGMGGMARGGPATGGAPMAQGMAGMAGGPSGGGSMAGSMGGTGLAPLLLLDAEVARTRADHAALLARRAAEEARLALLVGEDAGHLVASAPDRYLGDVGRDTEAEASPPERALAATSLDSAAADARTERAATLPTFMVATSLRVMPEGMVDGVDVQLGVTIPLWGGARDRVQAADAATEAATRRSERVEQTLTDARLAARADLQAATARAHALSEVVAPRARQAWELTLAAWAAGEGGAGDLVAAWQTQVAVTRDAAEANLTAELARARLARLEGR